MKQSQIVLAVLALALMLGVIVFAMNYLGGTREPSHSGGGTEQPRELVFFDKVFPPDDFSVVEQEDRTSGGVDYWFHNPHDAPVRLGLIRTSCKCTAVWVHFLPADRYQSLAAGAGMTTAAIGCSTDLAGALAAAAFQARAVQLAQREVEGAELLRGQRSVTVPAGTVGWVRMVYHGERPGRQSLEANLWMDNERTGKTALLALRLMFWEAFRVKGWIRLGTITEEDLAAGVQRDVVVFSSTRPRLKLDVKPASARSNPDSDPFQVAKEAIPLTQEEMRELERQIATPEGEVADGQPAGPVMSAYRVPVRLLAKSKDGTPFDVGPFRRRVMVSSPDVNLEPKAVLVTGRLQGLLDLGGDDEAGEVQLRSFKRSQGKRETMLLHATESDLKLEFDRRRTPEFLNATLTPGQPTGDGRPTWKMVLQAVPGKASGLFPRREDPNYEDSAIYLKATRPGKPDRRIRISVSGTATEG